MNHASELIAARVGMQLLGTALEFGTLGGLGCRNLVDFTALNPMISSVNVEHWFTFSRSAAHKAWGRVRSSDELAPR